MQDTFTLLLAFAAERTHRAPHRLGIEDLDAELIGEFISHLENDRGNTVATRNTRLAVRLLMATGGDAGFSPPSLKRTNKGHC